MCSSEIKDSYVLMMADVGIALKKATRTEQKAADFVISDNSFTGILKRYILASIFFSIFL